MTTFDEMPVASSSTSRIEMPSLQIDVMRDAVHLGDDRDRVRVPFGQPVAARHLRPVIGQQPRAVRHAVPRLLAAGLVEQHHLAVAAHHDRHDRPS